MEHEDYHLASAPDVSKKGNLHIWLSFIVLAVVLFAMVLGLTITYRFSIVEEIEKKVGSVRTEEIKDYEALMDAITKGRAGIDGSTKFQSIEDAQKQFLRNANGE